MSTDTNVTPLPKRTAKKNVTKSGMTVVPKTGNPKADAPKKAPKLSRAAKNAARLLADDMAQVVGDGVAPKKRAKAVAAKKKAAAKANGKKAAKTPRTSTRTERGVIAVVRERKSRVTGTTVQIVNTVASGSPVKPGSTKGDWARFCVDHNFVDYQLTRAAARVDASDPSAWCPKCRKLVGRAG